MIRFHLLMAGSWAALRAQIQIEAPDHAAAWARLRAVQPVAPDVLLESDTDESAHDAPLENCMVVPFDALLVLDDPGRRPHRPQTKKKCYRLCKNGYM
jgi:hypothetical protein